MGTAAILLLVVTSILLGLVIGLLLHRGAQAATGTPGQKRAEAYLKGVEYLLSNDRDSAIALLSRLARDDTESVETYFALGSLFRQKGEFARSIQIHQSLLARANLGRETRSKALLALAHDFQRAGLIDKAAATLQQLVDEDPDQREALDRLVEIHGRAGDVERALASVQQLRRLGATIDVRRLAALHVQAAHAELSAKQLDQAKRSLKTAAELDPSSPEVPLGRAEIHRQMGQGAKELEALLEAIALAPYVAPELETRLVALAAEGLPVLERLTMMADERDNDPFISTARASLLLARGETALAEQVLRTIVATEPRLMAARRRLSEIILADRDAGQRREVEELLSAPREALFNCTACGHSPPMFAWHCPACQAVGTLILRTREA